MDNNSSTPLTPTWKGYISSTYDAILLFEACLSGALNHVPRRPHDRERSDLIRSGNVFIYEEHASGIKRWTDGVSWSPSRILGNFLIYRELDKPFPPGEKKRALKKDRKPSSGGIVKHESSPSTNFNLSAAAAAADSSVAAAKDTERALIGSLVDSYDFKSSGLIKKTISITYQGVAHHLVSYYSVDEVTEGSLTMPKDDPALRCFRVRPDLIFAQNFRAPIDDMEYMVDRNGHPILVSPQHEMASNGNAHHYPRTISMPGFQQAVQMQSYGGPSPYSYPNQPHAFYGVGGIPSNAMSPPSLGSHSMLPHAMQSHGLQPHHMPSHPMPSQPLSSQSISSHPMPPRSMGSSGLDSDQDGYLHSTAALPTNGNMTLTATPSTDDTNNHNHGSINNNYHLQQGAADYVPDHSGHTGLPGLATGFEGANPHGYHLDDTTTATTTTTNNSSSTNVSPWTFDHLDGGQDQQYFSNSGT